ncbi:LOW QUALITY PROTEIN: hypothetical protein RJ639_021277 [Escallonia herrerae]|uniref:Uncharacterized protein n=1 Tax=Escallonia herrerae TaxID=1293975 RepID=A0AA89AI49_9ASTE|nr:LOW QUALITY PROTEIN: hypothetical protein RJ639_021277 [Escallonia herrerae]
MSGRGKGGNDLGKGGAKGHCNVLLDNIQCITKPTIRRLVCRGGVKRISGLIYTRPQDFPRERHPRRRHLHRALPPQDRDGHGRRLCAQEAGKYPVRLRWLGFGLTIKSCCGNLREEMTKYGTEAKNREKDLSETDLEHIEKLKGAPPLESKYPLSSDQLHECDIIVPSEPQDYDEEEKEGRKRPRAQWDPPLFNAQGILGDIIPDKLASVHGIVEEEMQDLDFGALISGSQPRSKDFVLGLSTLDKPTEAPKKQKVPSRAGSRATSSSVRPNTPHHTAWRVSIEESVFKSPHTAWDWSSHTIIPMDRRLSGYGVNETANGMVQLMAQAMAQVQIGAEKLIAVDKVLNEEKKKVLIENNFCREAEKKVEDLSKKVERLELSNVDLTARINQLETEKSTAAVQAVQLFKKSKSFLDQRYCDSKRALVHSYNECKDDIQKDHPELDLSPYKHKFTREIAAKDII